LIFDILFIQISAIPNLNNLWKREQQIKMVKCHLKLTSTNSWLKENSTVAHKDSRISWILKLRKFWF
jgi:hypothetical protein